jgi:hypothetical protein
LTLCDHRLSRAQSGFDPIACFEPATVVVDDRGYNDYRLFAKWTEEEVYFVTRLKENALYKVIERRAVPQNRRTRSSV